MYETEGPRLASLRIAHRFLGNPSASQPLPSSASYPKYRLPDYSVWTSPPRSESPPCGSGRSRQSPFLVLTLFYYMSSCSSRAFGQYFKDFGCPQGNPQPGQCYPLLSRSNPQDVHIWIGGRAPPRGTANLSRDCSQRASHLPFVTD
jgi:hypothetical protein